VDGRVTLGSASVLPLSIAVPLVFCAAIPAAKLEALLGHLKTRQRGLIMEAAQYTLPADSTLKRIAELENAIAAVEAVADEGGVGGTGRLVLS
jgi:hypothetical protein